MPAIAKAALLEHLDYSVWATNRLLEACSTLEPEIVRRDTGSSHGGMLGTLLHIYGAEAAWIARLDGTIASFQRPSPDTSLEDLRRDWPQLWQRWQQWLNRITEADLETDLHGQLFSGREFRLPRWKVVLHVVNHATLHRGQVMTMLRQAGIAPPMTDASLYYFSQQD